MTLKLGLSFLFSGLALLAGIDEALEAIFQIVDMFHMDSYHGLISLSLLGIIRAVSDALDDFRDAKSA
ncbi:MAG: hypothetical protein VW226_12080 [Rhodospirillaceae bacterium]|jgi:hypothetical protein